jgi:aldehyde dehydrogenase (NAD+)
MSSATLEDESTISVIDPSTGELVREVEAGGATAIDAAVARARETFESGVWHKKPASERARILWKLADLLEGSIDELADIESLNVGLRPVRARGLVKVSAEYLRYCAGWCSKIAGRTIELNVNGPTSLREFHTFTLKQPIGVAGLITPWNGPLYCAVMKLAPALAAGCSCVLKPSELAPLFVPPLERLMQEAGIPDGVANIVNGYGHIAGAALAAHPDVDKIAFTGSTQTGRQIVQASTGNLKRVMLELGGKSPVLVFNDADIERAVAGAAMGIYTNAGQGCIAGSRIYVQRGIHDEFVDRLATTTRAIKVGGRSDDDADIGPVVSERQLQRIMGFIEEGRSSGADIVVGGCRIDRPGFFVEPTMIAGATPEMRLVREEIFGPVVAVGTFEDENDALRQANTSTYGLAAYVWTNNVGRAHRMVKSLQAGMVWINCQLVYDPAVPVGGYKQSGWGREGAWEGIDAFLETKAAYLDLQV